MLPDEILPSNNQCCKGNRGGEEAGGKSQTKGEFNSNDLSDVDDADDAEEVEEDDVDVEHPNGMPPLLHSGEGGGVW